MGADDSDSTQALCADSSGLAGGVGESKEPRKKKARTTFSGRQIFELERQFEKKKYLSSTERSEMAVLLNVTEQQVHLTPERYTQCYSSIRMLARRTCIIAFTIEA